MIQQPTKPRQPTLWDSERMRMTDAIELTIQSMRTYGPRHNHWGIAWSGGKDSTATLTLLLWLIDSGQIDAPESLTVFYADTRQELPPLAIAAYQIISKLQERGVPVRIVMAPLDKRFLVYILGRGVPPPNNNTLRWCTRQIKLDPMQAAVAEMFAANDGQQFLMITGVRQGESAIRDQRIAMSCGKDGAECGQGWYQTALNGERCYTLSPLLHWRVCHIWDWLRFYASAEGWPTAIIADAYGGEEAEEINARTGCIGCPLAQEERALEAILKLPAWQYLAPLKQLKPLYRALRLPEKRLRKPGGERRKDGTLVKNQQRMGPLTLRARRWGLARVLEIQHEVNIAAAFDGRPEFDILNPEESARIRELIATNTWPDGWTGDEPLATEPMDAMYADGSVQPLLIRGDAP